MSDIPAAPDGTGPTPGAPPVGRHYTRIARRFGRRKLLLLAPYIIGIISVWLPWITGPANTQLGLEYYPTEAGVIAAVYMILTLLLFKGSIRLPLPCPQRPAASSASRPQRPPYTRC